MKGLTTIPCEIALLSTTSSLVTSSSITIARFSFSLKVWFSSFKLVVFWKKVWWTFSPSLPSLSIAILKAYGLPCKTLSTSHRVPPCVLSISQPSPPHQQSSNPPSLALSLCLKRLLKVLAPSFLTVFRSSQFAFEPHLTCQTCSKYPTHIALYLGLILSPIYLIGAVQWILHIWPVCLYCLACMHSTWNLFLACTPFSLAVVAACAWA